MKTLELQSLLKGEEKQIEIPVELQKVFETWKGKRSDDVLQPLEIFLCWLCFIKSGFKRTI